ncbi:MAG TPA: glycosyl hydrolase family 28-related protein, partial [Steroidobacter sp.]|nr:glycosyl hydrolase family 28-related protein [Steroidobacter sp.]
MRSSMNRRTFVAGAGAVTLVASGKLPAATKPAEAWERAADIARNVRPPTFPDRVFDITRFGAVADGTTLNTAMIAKAIAACVAAGGGRVLVPAGKFLTGAIHLKSNVELHVAAGATLCFDTNPASYPLVFTRWEGMELMNYSPLIYAFEQQNIAITGKGTLDGQGSAKHWWPWKGRWGGTIDHGWVEGMPTQLEARTELFNMAEARV